VRRVFRQQSKARCENYNNLRKKETIMATNVPKVGKNNEIEARVQRELDSIYLNENGERILSEEKIEELAVETRLTILLDAGDKYVPIADQKALEALSDKYYDDLSTQGGLAYHAYDKYARECPTLLVAAKRHREFIQSKKKQS
jgi:uncharacterized protein (UPF0276 family)